MNPENSYNNAPLYSGAELGSIKAKMAFGKFLRVTAMLSFFPLIGVCLVTHMFVLIVVVIAVCVLMILWGERIKKKAMEQYGKAVVEPMAREIFPNAEFTYSEKNLNLDRFFNLGLITRDDDEYVTNHLVSNDEHELENFSLLCQHTDSDSDGHSSTVTTFSGTVVSYKIPTGVQGVVRVITSQQLNLLIVKKETVFVRRKSPLTPEKIETGSIAFDDHFEVYASDQHTGFYVLNAYVIEKLQAFREKYGNFAITITANYLYVSFNKIDKFIRVPDRVSRIDANPFGEARENLNELIAGLNDLAFAISKSTARERTI